MTTTNLTFGLYYEPQAHGPDSDEAGFESRTTQPYYLTIPMWKYENLGKPPIIMVKVEAILADELIDFGPEGFVTSICVNDSCRVVSFREAATVSQRRCPGCGTFAHTKDSLDDSSEES